MKNTLFYNGLVINSPLLDYEVAIPTCSIGWDAEVKKFLKNNNLLMQIEGFHTPHIQFGSTYYNSAYMVRGFNPKQSIVIAYNQTKGIINYRNKQFRQNEILILTNDEETDLVVNDENITYTIAFEEEFFNQAFYNYFGIDFDENKKHKIVLNPYKNDNFVHFLRYWVKFFLEDETRNILFNSYEKIEYEITDALFCFIEIDNQHLKKENNLLKKAREIIEDSIKYDFRLSDIAKDLNISQRTLEYTFKQNLGLSPKKYLQIFRLYAVRDELKTANPSVTKISEIALKYDFFHMGHFANEYKKLFGESPSQTLIKQTTQKNNFS